MRVKEEYVKTPIHSIALWEILLKFAKGKFDSVQPYAAGFRLIRNFRVLLKTNLHCVLRRSGKQSRGIPCSSSSVFNDDGAKIQILLQTCKEWAIKFWLKILEV